MDIFPHGKINLSFYITGKREDGYHQVDTLYWPLALFDYLKLEPAEKPGITSSETTLETPDNLVLKAWRLMAREYGVPPLQMHLEKGIPWEAGLGGGSGDAAAVLSACNRLFRLGLTRKKLCALGAGLGADVPACLLDVPSRGKGSGAEVTPLRSRLKLPLLILKPPAGFSTPAMYKAWDERGGAERNLGEIEEAQQGLIKALEGNEIRAVLPYLHNDFESVLQDGEKEIWEEAVHLLSRRGALGSLLCGSGSGVFGLWEREEDRQAAKEELLRELPEGWRLLVPFPGLAMIGG